MALRPMSEIREAEFDAPIIVQYTDGHRFPSFMTDLWVSGLLFEKPDEPVEPSGKVPGTWHMFDDCAGWEPVTMQSDT